MKPLSIAFLSALPLLAQVEPGAGTWKTFVLTNGSQFRLPPPPDAAATAQELAWLKLFRTTVNDTARAQVAYWDQGSASYHWVQWLQDKVLATGINTPNFTRQFALMNVAIHDAMVAAWDSKYAHKRLLPSQVDPSFATLVQAADAPSYPNDFAVAAGAAETVLAYLYPADAAALKGMAEEAARSRLFAGVAYPSDYFAGLELGRRVGQLVVERGRNDNSTAVFAGTIPTTPGSWTGTNPACPACGIWRPWVLTSGSQFRADPPFAFNSPQKQAEIAALRAEPRAFADQARAFYVQSPQGSFYDYYNAVHLAILEDHLSQNAPRVARAYALMSVAQYDAMISVWESKFVYWAARPFQLDPGLTTLFATPNHPSYPAAHATNSTAITEIMAYLFPTRADQYLAIGRQAGDSRKTAGIHFQSDVDAGNIQGRRVAQAVIDWAR